MSKSIDPQSKKIIKKGLRNAYPVLVILRLFIITNVNPSRSKQDKPNGIKIPVILESEKGGRGSFQWIQIQNIVTFTARNVSKYLLEI